MCYLLNYSYVSLCYCYLCGYQLIVLLLLSLFLLFCVIFGVWCLIPASSFLFQPNSVSFIYNFCKPVMIYKDLSLEVTDK